MILRKGLKYSEGTPVRASDFKASIERVFKLNSPGSSFYASIVGAETFEETKSGGMSRIEADDGSGRIVIHLTAAHSPFSDELAVPFAAPVPANTPA